MRKRTLVGIAAAVALALTGCTGPARLLSVVGGTVEASSPDAAPSDLVVSKGGSTAIEIAWTDNSELEAGFEIERNDAIVSSVAAGSESYADTGLTTDTTYTYRVRATYPYGATEWSAPRPVKPAIAAWARAPTAAVSGSSFGSVSVDRAGNIYAAGFQSGTDTFTYGDQNIAGTASTNPVLVKYDSDGTALWARTISAGTLGAQANAVATDRSGNSYIAGRQSGDGTYTYGTIDLTGASTADNPILVKYDANGTALWARTISAGPGNVQFHGVAVDQEGNVYVAGRQDGGGTYTYGTIDVTGPAGVNPILVKYDSGGTPLWARTTDSGTASAHLNGVAANGNSVYVVGLLSTTATNTYGTVSVTGIAGGDNPLLLKYDADGTAQWGRTTAAGGTSTFKSVSAASNRVAVVGSQDSGGAYTYGTQTFTSPTPLGSGVVVLYDTDGVALWADGQSAPNDLRSFFSSLAIDGDGNVFVVGYQNGTRTFTYGGKDVQNPEAREAILLLKYSPTGAVEWARTATATPSGGIYSFWTGIAVDEAGGVITAGNEDVAGTFTFGNVVVTDPGSTSFGVVVKWWR